MNHSEAALEIRNSPIYARIESLMLADENGTMRKALELKADGLRHYCHMPVVADLANLTFYHLQRIKSAASIDSGSYLEEEDSIPDALRIMLSVIFIIVGCIGIVGNILTVIVIYKTTSLHSHTNYFLASLAISDLCLIVVGVPYDVLHILKHPPPHIAGYCAFISTTISLFTFVSILTIVSLTAERFVAICYPFGHRALFDKRRVINLIYFLWFIAFFPSLYIGMQFKRVLADFCGYNHEMLDSPDGSCDIVTSSKVPYRYHFEVIMLVTFALPLIFIVYCYFRILATLNEMAAQTTVHMPIGNTNSDSSQVNSPCILYVHTKNYAPPKSQQAQRMVIKMLVTVTSVFFICYLPYHIERLIVQYTKHECDKSTVCLLLYPITGLLQYVSATLNPIFYNLMSMRFRTAFNELIKNTLPKKEKHYCTIPRI